MRIINALSMLFAKRIPFVILGILVYWTTLDQISQVLQDDVGGTPPFDDNNAPTINTNISDIEKVDSSLNASTPWVNVHNTVVTQEAPSINTSISYTYYKIRVEQDETFMWKGKQRKFCKHIEKELPPTFNNSTSMVAMYFGVPCRAMHRLHRHGNYVYGLYAMHIGAFAYNADLLFICSETNDYENLFWWMQTLPNSLDRKRNLLATSRRIYDPPRPPPSMACAGMGKIPYEYVSEMAKYDFRRMACAVFGPRNNNPSMAEFGQAYPELPVPADSTKQDRLPSNPLYPGVELDSVAIHFRCGDVLSRLSADMNENYGLLPFYIYQSILEQHADQPISSIGIITAPFDPTHLRKQDAKHAEQCQSLVGRLRDYLAEHFPTARVSIRNDKTDTIPMVYSRLVMADQLSVCIRSTFCVFATLASFAKRRVLLDGGVSYFAPALVAVDDSVVVLNQTETPYLLSHEIHDLGWNSTMEWLLQTKEWHHDRKQLENAREADEEAGQVNVNEDGLQNDATDVL